MVNLITEHIDIWTAAQIQKTNGGRGRGKNSNGPNPHGIKKLRELILELAIRGKLVPQDPNNEQASVLLKKIAEERTHLVKEKKIKKPKALPEITDEEKPFSRPNGWQFVRLNDLGEWGAGATPTRSRHDYYGGDIPWFKSGELMGDYISSSEELVTKLALKETSLRYNKAGDVLVAMYGATIGKTSILKIPATTNQAVCACTPFSGVTNIFLLTLLKAYKNRFIGMGAGGAQPNISREKIIATVVALPPLAEQHRIVAKVDELMALCDQLEQQQTGSNATHQTLLEALLSTLTTSADQSEFAKAWQRIANHFDILFTTEQSIDQLKQTILQLAVMGKLVPQDPTDLPAPVRASHADGPVRASHADGPQSGKFFVYALECENKSIYIGQTNDILNRWKEHATGKGADWTKNHPPQRLVHWEEYNSREEAITREKELKTGFGRKWLKRELAAGRTRQAGEPASVLLEKIAKEKTRSLKERKPLPPINEGATPFELPQGWAWARFPEVGEFGRGKSKNRPRNDPSLYSGGKYPMVQTGDVARANGVVETFTALYNDKGLSQSRLWPKGTMCITIAANIADSSILGFDACFPDSVVGLIPSAKIGDARYFEYFMRTAKEHLMNFAPSTAQKNINLGILETVLIPLPPAEEIKRIVTKVDEFMTLCDTLKARLNDAQTTQVQLADAIVEQAGGINKNRARKLHGS